MKVLLWLAVVLVVVFWVLHTRKASNKADEPAPGPGRKAASSDVEPMIRCAHCGTHVPASESVVAPSGAVFCSEEHRRLHG